MEKILITCSFGLEAIIKRELNDLGYENIKVSDGMIEIEAILSDIAKINMSLRCADRVYLLIDSFKARTYDELFENVKAIPWPDFLSEDSNFLVNARSFKSKLYSLRDIQSISEKAIIESMKKTYRKNIFSKSAEKVGIEIMLERDIARITIDTTGPGLHKRGYREDSVKAPLRENLAAALVDLSFYNKDRFLFDGFCGSGTILIEAARKARNIAPGLDRDFDFQKFIFMDKDIYKKAKVAALEAIDYDTKLNLLGSDISGRAIELAKNNAINAGVEEDISFIKRDFGSVALKDDYGIIISNLPYGLRLSKIDLDEIYRKINHKFKNLETRSQYYLTTDESFEKKIKRRASKKRKLYNGGEKVDYYQYFGPRPKKS
ncbi:class I SAM-dependent RNA methyltransferase [Anaerococcus sp. AGMB09787]|uniref:THUMP domain-containing class I SAM-dependent RNA methyltransferase n=1 Tax=Anaerococcus sp. AGMB09787 TaxID=2922869 RepID=UPI001FB0209E|nr:class I SAM-dependent RNA methyltransferase [Anaerococcus sp. AGMB09787]